MSSINAPIPLGEANVEITVRGKPVETVAQVYMRLLPKPRVVLECEVRDKFLLGQKWGASIVLLERNTSLDVICVAWTYNEGVTKLSFIPLSEPCTVFKQEKQRLQSVSFDVLNFPSFIGPQDKIEEFTDDHGGSGGRRCGQVNLEADGWRIQITAVSELKENVDALNEQGGYGVTHNGVLERLNGETFSIEDAENAMDCLWRFLSFARGQSCSPFLPIGLNSDGEVVWKQWGSHQIEAWGGTFSWFDTHHAAVLAEVFPGFWDGLNGSPHAAAARTALAWYLRSNRDNGDQAGGLILSQTALERLADAHGFNKNNVGSAAKCIRKLIHRCSIPSKLPDGLDTLNEVLCAGQKNAEVNGGKDKIFDGPEALVAVRNDLVHPKAYFAGISGLKEYEAWNLAQWYVELVLLKMFGFNGKYANRLIAGRWVGHVEPVPWAPALD